MNISYDYVKLDGKYYKSIKLEDLEKEELIAVIKNCKDCDNEVIISGNNNAPLRCNNLEEVTGVDIDGDGEVATTSE